MSDPNRWQPLALDKQDAQNGVPIPGKVQKYVTPFWGHVTSFGDAALARGTPIDAGPPPRLGSTAEQGRAIQYKADASASSSSAASWTPTDGVTDGHLSRHAGQQRPGHERWHWLQHQPDDG